MSFILKFELQHQMIKSVIIPHSLCLDCRIILHAFTHNSLCTGNSIRVCIHICRGRVCTGESNAFLNIPVVY